MVLLANAAIAVQVGFASGVLGLFPNVSEGCPKSGPSPQAQPVMNWTPVLAFGTLAAGALLISAALLLFGPRSTALVQTVCAVILCLVAVNVTVTEWRDAHPQLAAAEEELHDDENSAHRRTAEMSPSSERAARAEAARIEPVLGRLWEHRTWDVASVRAALRELGYGQQQSTKDGRYGILIVTEINQQSAGLNRRFETDPSATPPGSIVALWVRPDACIAAYVQSTNYEVKVTGPYLETGCFEPPRGH
ncbi:DUF6234 family protein [Streptomyces sp. N35]|uniref:DUF6234 family protein n=1 Tax=Streptomyces sp. N35 TaxID=2795730 RepID=UPI001F2BC67A|nr:DUF6234 family protein [Streptomyces sp. N35]